MQSTDTMCPERRRKLSSKFNTANNIIRDIITIVKDKAVSYLDATLLYSETQGIEIETLAEIITKNPKIKASIQEEAEELNYIKKTVNRLPF